MSSVNSFKLVYVLTVLLALSHKGTCLDCYVCSTENSHECAIISLQTPRIQCLGPYNECYKTVVGDTISRTCGVNDICIAVNTACGSGAACKTKLGCHACTGDLCNSSSKIVSSIVIASITGLVTFAYII